MNVCAFWSWSKRRGGADFGSSPRGSIGPRLSSQRWRAGGVAAVEFALVLIPMTVLVFGAAEVGRMLYQQNSLTQAVHVGARYIGRQAALVNNADCSLQSAARWQSVRQEAAGLIVCGEPGMCGGRAPVVPGLTVGDVTISNPIRRAGACVIELEARTPFQPLFGESVVPLLQIPVPALNARIEERYIGY